LKVFYGVKADAGVEEHPSITEAKIRDVIKHLLQISRDVSISKVRQEELFLYFCSLQTLQTSGYLKLGLCKANDKYRVLVSLQTGQTKFRIPVPARIQPLIVFAIGKDLLGVYWP